MCTLIWEIMKFQLSCLTGIRNNYLRMGYCVLLLLFNEWNKKLKRLSFGSYILVAEDGSQYLENGWYYKRLAEYK